MLGELNAELKVSVVLYVTAAVIRSYALVQRKEHILLPCHPL